MLQYTLLIPVTFATVKKTYSAPKQPNDYIYPKSWITKDIWLNICLVLLYTNNLMNSYT